MDRRQNSEHFAIQKALALRHNILHHNNTGRPHVENLVVYVDGHGGILVLTWNKKENGVFIQLIELILLQDLGVSTREQHQDLEVRQQAEINLQRKMGINYYWFYLYTSHSQLHKAKQIRYRWFDYWNLLFNVEVNYTLNQ